MPSISFTLKLLLIKIRQRDLTGFFAGSVTFLSLLTIYSLAAFILLPKGVNSHFAGYLWKIMLGTTLFFTLLFFAWKQITKKMGYTLKRKPEPVQAIDLIFVLLPITPVAQYLVSNQDTVTAAGSILIFLFFAAISAILGVAVPVLLSRFAAKHVMITAATGFLCLVTSMAAISAAYGWNRKGIWGIQLAIFAAILIVLSLRRFLPAKLAAAAIALFFIINTVSGIAFREPKGGTPSNIKKLPSYSKLEGIKLKKQNDILLLVYEAYPNYETLRHYGFDNKAQMNMLKTKGFHVYNGTYSLGAPTEQSLSKVFNIDRDISEHKRYLAAGGVVHSFFSGRGYGTYGVFDNSWNLRGLPIDEIKYSSCFPKPAGVMDTKVLINAIFTGEFSDAVSFEGVDYNSYLARKREVLTGKPGSPAFLYSHSSFPGHGPSGQGMSLEEREGKISGHIDGIIKANEEMNLDIDAVIKNNPGAIVIIAGDHGPFLTKTGYGLSKGRGNFKASDIDRYDIQDRFGMFLAIRWPEKQYASRHDIKIFQDIFPAVISYLAEDDSLFSKLRIEATTKENFRTLGVYVKDGIIVGGKDNGQKLFLMKE